MSSRTAIVSAGGCRASRHGLTSQAHSMPPVEWCRKLKNRTGNTCRTPATLFKPRDRRRQICSLSPPVTASSSSSSSSSSAYFLGLPSVFPLGPFFTRKTIRTELVKGQIWGFEQPQTLANVTVNIRMTVVRLTGGGLLVYAPIAPTAECNALLLALGGAVEVIILPTFAIEHKIFLGPFARAHPAARVFAAPGQWSFPVNLPLLLLGGRGAEAEIVDGPEMPGGGAWPWVADFDHMVFKASVGVGPYSEALFFHKPTRTLLVTDFCVCVPRQPPAVVLQRPAGLLASAKDAPGDDVKDTPQNRLKGYMRQALQICYFGPKDIVNEYENSFNALAGRLIVSPILQMIRGHPSAWSLVNAILQVLVFGKCERRTRTFLEAVSRWQFKSIIPAHFQAPVSAGPAELRAAFDAVYARPGSPAAGGFLAGLLNPRRVGVGMATVGDDMAVLTALNKILISTGVADNGEG